MQEKLDHSYSAVKNVKWCSPSRKPFTSSLWNYTCDDHTSQQLQTWNIYPRKMKTQVHTKTSTRICTAVLFIKDTIISSDVLYQVTGWTLTPISTLLLHYYNCSVVKRDKLLMHTICISHQITEWKKLIHSLHTDWLQLCNFWSDALFLKMEDRSVVSSNGVRR